MSPHLPLAITASLAYGPVVSTHHHAVARSFTHSSRSRPIAILSPSLLSLSFQSAGGARCLQLGIDPPEWGYLFHFLLPSQRGRLILSCCDIVKFITVWSMCSKCISPMLHTPQNYITTLPNRWTNVLALINIILLHSELWLKLLDYEVSEIISWRMLPLLLFCFLLIGLMEKMENEYCARFREVSPSMVIVEWVGWIDYFYVGSVFKWR